MKYSSVWLSGLGLALGMLSGVSEAQTSVDFGKNEFMASCAS